MRLPTRPAAFTLIELLVVISIVTLLISILLPSLGKARDNAVQTTCLGNLRQVGIAMATYVADNKELYPEPYCIRNSSIGGGNVQSGFWGFHGGAFDAKYTPTNLIWDYSSSKNLFRCPTDAMFATSVVAGVTVTSVSYGMSILAAYTTQPDSEGRVDESNYYYYGTSPYPDYVRSLKSSQIRNTRAVLYAETTRWDGYQQAWLAYRSDFVHPSAGADSYYYGNGRPQLFPGTIAVLRGQAHPNGMNVTALDGSGRFEIGHKEITPPDIQQTWYVR